jgi:hypothetical protein
MQQLHLRNVHTTNTAYRNAKRDALLRAKEIAAEEIAGYLNARNLEVRLAYEAGIPKSQIGREGMGTSDPKTVEDALNATQRSVDVELESAPLSGPSFTRNDDRTITLTLHGQAFEAACREFGWDSGKAPNSWALDAEGYPIAETDFIPEIGKRHPVGAWAVRNIGVARDWARDQVAETSAKPSVGADR